MEFLNELKYLNELLKNKLEDCDIYDDTVDDSAKHIFYLHKYTISMQCIVILKFSIDHLNVIVAKSDFLCAKSAHVYKNIKEFVKAVDEIMMSDGIKMLKANVIYENTRL
jgi:hypothetical protein